MRGRKWNAPSVMQQERKEAAGERYESETNAMVENETAKNAIVTDVRRDYIYSRTKWNYPCMDVRRKLV